MKIFTPADSFIKPFESVIGKCRHINDILILFRRDGTVISLRSPNSRLRTGDNIYDFMSETDAKTIADLCISFEYNRLLVDTDFGTAVIYTEMCGACGLLVAVIPFASKECLLEHLNRFGMGSLFVPESVKLSNNNGFEGNIYDVGESFKKADEVFLTVGITAAKYRLEVDIIKVFGEYIISSADYIGCVGRVKSVLSSLPKLENFSPEMYSAMTACSILFARNRGKSRGFKAKIGEYNSHLVVSFYIDVDDDFKIFINGRYKSPELEFCSEIAKLRDTFFDCYLRDGETPYVVIAYIPEIDPMDGRMIKEPIEKRVEEFWQE